MGYWKQFLILFALNFADFSITRPLVREAGISAEWSPIMKKVIELSGVDGIWTFKFFFLCFLAIILMFLSDPHYGNQFNRAKILATRGILLLNIWTGIVVMWGLFNLIKVFG